MTLRTDKADDIIEAMAQAKRILISGPSYINTWPGPLIALLEQAAQHSDRLKGKRLYGIINGGMPYVHTHLSGLRTLQLFCRDVGLRWEGGFVLGGGAMLDGQPLEKHLSHKRMVPAFERFTQHVMAGEPSPDSLYERANGPMPGLVARLVARMLNRTVDRRLRDLGQDPYQRHPSAP